MASEDVIELGSSDDDVEPVPKRKKTVPNAMVHIPSKLHGVTIKPSTSKGAETPKANVISKISPKNAAITVTKVPKVINPLANKNKCNGKSNQKPGNRNLVMIPTLISGKAPTTQAVNPVHLFKKLNSQVVINKVPSTSKVMKTPITVNSPKTINNLPPSITVKRGPGTSGPVINRKIIHHISMKANLKPSKIGRVTSNKLQKVKPKVSDEVYSIDDDDAGSSPQWYLRPEDQSKPTLEEENNKEPEKEKLIEITIEDSPVKPKPIKAVEDFSVIIEDSPVKVVSEKDAATKSDEENSAPCETPRQSKKKLEYPKDQEKTVIEIEVEPMEVDKDTNNIDTTQTELKEKETIALPDVIVEIEESPMKEPDAHITSTPKKNHNRPAVKFPDEKLSDNSSVNSEFHPVYLNFIKLCFELENSEDMTKIIEKKVKTYYRQVPKEYTESEQFIDMVSSKILAMKASPDKMYLFIKDIVDELNLQRKMAKSQPPKSEKDKIAAAESENFLYGENSEFDSKRQRQIRKLEKTLKKLHRAIQKLEEQEVDFDDEEDSVYLLTERYKERMMRVHAKFCQLTNTKMPSEPRLLLDPRPGHPAGPAKKLEKWINKKVPIGTPLPFPDFHDVLRCVKEANEEDKLGWNDVDVMEEARDLFTRCGKKLQRRRQENEWRTAVSRISLDADPAEENEELRKKLDQNKQMAAKKEVEVFNKFADKQNQLKLEAEEIGDKEAEESPVESEEEEEETVDEQSLENKHNRKERLKRLLQEKSKKNSDEKENEPTETTSTSHINKETKDSTPKDVEMKSVEDEEIKKSENDNTKIEKASPANIKNDTNSKDTDNQVDANIDDVNKLESDIDELHLLQKLYSENEVNSSTVDSSDSEAPISISDTLDSDSADKKSVISIENSSYSESEINKSETFETDMEKDTSDPKDTEAVSIPSKEVIKETVDTNIEIECSESGIRKKRIQSNNDEYNESVEDILLASSDDEAAEKDNPVNEGNHTSGDSPGSIGECGTVTNPGSVEDTVNLKDDNLSIGETVVGDENNDVVQQNALDSALNKNRVNKCGNSNDEGSYSTGSLNNENIDKSEVTKGLTDDVISLDADSVMQTKAGLGDEDDKLMSNNDNLTSNEEVGHECVSLDDDSSAGDTVFENVDQRESYSQSQDVEKNDESKNTESEESCCNDVEKNVTDTIDENIKTVDSRMNVNDDLESNMLNSKTSKDNVDNIMTDPTFTEGITLQTTT